MIFLKYKPLDKEFYILPQPQPVGHELKNILNYIKWLNRNPVFILVVRKQ